jgi:hypothetical protein
MMKTDTADQPTALSKGVRRCEQVAAALIGSSRQLDRVHSRCGAAACTALPAAVGDFGRQEYSWLSHLRSVFEASGRHKAVHVRFR